MWRPEEKAAGPARWACGVLLGVLLEARGRDGPVAYVGGPWVF